MTDSSSNYNDSLFANSELGVHTTEIPGLLIFDLVVHGDARGWFKENYQQEKMVALGLPADFHPIQNNVSSNKEVGVTRGIHAEPWRKFISLTRGKAFIAIVDLRKGETFGKIVTLTLTPAQAIFLPLGMGNSYQTLEPDTDYAYLVDAHWSPDAAYTFVNLADESLNIAWPIALESAIVSDKDKAHPPLKDITPMEI